MIRPGFWLFDESIVTQCVETGEGFYDYGYRTSHGVLFIKGNFLERYYDSDTIHTNKLSLSLFYSHNMVKTKVV